MRTVAPCQQVPWWPWLQYHGAVVAAEGCDATQHPISPHGGIALPVPSHPLPPSHHLSSLALLSLSSSINHDATRIPADIPEARCLCTGCINPFTMQEDRTMASIPIYSRLPVRRLLCQVPGEVGHKPSGKKKCQKKYQMVMETIAVGCTCIF